MMQEHIRSFQLTRSRGAWLFDGKEWNTEKNFNSHAHVERDVLEMLDNKKKDISTHTLTWSVTLYVCKLLPLFQFQLTRSRGAWLWNIQTAGVKLEISTHTLTWSVTRVKKLVNYQTLISTHTLTWSVTWRFQQMMFTLYDFNSHAHVERDLNSNCGDKWRYHFNSHAHVERDYFSDVSDMLHKISTHTLTWSVTVCSEI